MLYASLTVPVSEIVAVADFGEVGTVRRKGEENSEWVSHVTLGLLRDCLHGGK